MSISDTKAIELYTMGKSCAEVAQIDGCSETSAYNRLKELGVTMRSRSEANKIFPDSIFISLYNLGLSSSQTGRLLGIDSSTVKKRLRVLMFPLRSRCVASRIRYTEQEFRRYFMVPGVLDQLVKLIC
jgi:DNA-binding CsgD family transcriptional regulator